MKLLTRVSIGIIKIHCPLRSFCLLYTSDAADERSSVDLGGRRIIKKKTNTVFTYSSHIKKQTLHQMIFSTTTLPSK